MLSLCCHADMIGAAWSGADEDTLYMLQEDISIDDTARLLERTEGPVMGSLRVPTHIVEMVRAAGRDFIMQSNKEFTISIYVPASARQDHNDLSQRALNALIKSGSGSALHGEIVMVGMGEHLHLSMQALQDLDILEYMDHPNPHFGKTMSGKCLISLLNMAKSVGGKALLKKWICYPLCDSDRIMQRQSEINVFCDNQGLIETVQSSLRGVKNVHYVMAKMQTENNCNHIKAILKFMESALQTYSVWSTTPLSQKILIENPDDWSQITTTIKRVVDFDRSKLEGDRVIIKYGVDGNLDELRDLYMQLPEKLSEVAIEIAEAVKARESSTVKALNVVYFPQLGYLTAAPVIHQYELLGLFPDWESVFTTDKIAYFKNTWMRQLDEQLGDVHANIVDCEIEIYEQLRRGLVELRGEMDMAYKSLCELDCLAALAQAVTFHNLSPITFGENVNLRSSRHLIAEHCCSFIQNDLLLTKEKAITVITGPNASGKSVLMKQIGLHVLMAQSIGYIAADSTSQLPMIKNILTRIKAVESAGRQRSAFAMEIEQLQEALSASDPNSLLLIDEFGKGTLPEDGIALLAATIEYLADLPQPPWCVIVTHFTEVAGLLRSDVREDKVNWLQMSIHEDDSNNPVYLFKATEGVCQKSLGMHCARLAGIDESILEDAADIAIKLQAGIPTRDLAWAAVPEEQEQQMAALIRDTL